MLSDAPKGAEFGHGKIRTAGLFADRERADDASAGQERKDRGGFERYETLERVLLEVTVFEVFDDVVAIEFVFFLFEQREERLATVRCIASAGNRKHGREPPLSLTGLPPTLGEFER